MVSFKVAPFFTRMPIMETTSLLSRHFEDILRLFCYVLASYVSFTGQLYEQNEGMAMRSLLFTAIANFFMEDFEMVLNWPDHKPLCCFSHVDDTFIILKHRPDRPNNFFNHPKSV
jgi:hypothetical protein